MVASGREVGQPQRRANILAPILPNLVALLGECGQVQGIPRVDYVPNVGGHLSKEQDLLDLTTEFDCRALSNLSWSIRTEGLLDRDRGWSSHLTALWWALSP